MGEKQIYDGVVVEGRWLSVEEWCLGSVFGGGALREREFRTFVLVDRVPRAGMQSDRARKAVDRERPSGEGDALSAPTQQARVDAMESRQCVRMYGVLVAVRR
jgi:hypothetical protein